VGESENGWKGQKNSFGGEGLRVKGNVRGQIHIAGIKAQTA